jgi:hypothetical protein
MMTGNYWSETQQETVSQTDTSFVSVRNSISDVTFYDPENIVTRIDLESCNGFPFLFTSKSRLIEAKKREFIIKHLKPGEERSQKRLQDDWVLGIILIVASIFALVRIISKSLFPGIARFFLFRGINDPGSRDVAGLFHWQSTMLNLISFFVIALFCLSAGSVYEIIPSGFSSILVWLISLAVIIIAVTLRHFICTITGNISGQIDALHDYLTGVYQSYRFSALFLFVIVILMNYTVIFPARVLIIPGIVVFGVMYLIRLLRLILIFLNRNLSIFYLILYICGLEFLPVLITVRYFTGIF